MIRLLELLSAGLTFTAYVLAMISAVLIARKVHDKRAVAIILAGFLLAEFGRYFRILGPDVAFEAGPSISLSHDSSLAVFLGKTLILPTGLLVAAVGCFLLARKIIPVISNKDR